MGIYIRGMEMPKNCIKCKLCVSYKCVLTGEIRWSDEFDYDSKRFEDCPLVPVPPHGRLVDADKMRESIKRQTGFLKLMGGEFAIIAETLENGFLQEIDNAPTIIPAEEGET